MKKTAENKIIIKSTGTKRFPYFCLFEGKNELCHTIVKENAERIVKALEFQSLPPVSEEEIRKEIRDKAFDYAKDSRLSKMDRTLVMGSFIEGAGFVLSRLPQREVEQPEEKKDIPVAEKRCYNCPYVGEDS